MRLEYYFILMLATSARIYAIKQRISPFFCNYNFSTDFKRLCQRLTTYIRIYVSKKKKDLCGSFYHYKKIVVLFI